MTVPLAREGLREMAAGTVVLGALAFGAAILHWSLVLPPLLVWLWLISFFRDPSRCTYLSPGLLCAPADGTVTEIRDLDRYPPIEGPAIRIGIFLSIFNVHVNRLPCAGQVRSVSRAGGEYLDARHPESGSRNASCTIVLDPTEGLAGPVIVRQVVGKIARRIVCHAAAGQQVVAGERFGMIKFGSRTELVVPRLAGTSVTVQLGQKVRAGLTTLIRQSTAEAAPKPDSSIHEPLAREGYRICSGVHPRAGRR